MIAQVSLWFVIGLLLAIYSDCRFKWQRQLETRICISWFLFCFGPVVIAISLCLRAVEFWNDRKAGW